MRYSRNYERKSVLQGQTALSLKTNILFLLDHYISLTINRLFSHSTAFICSDPFFTLKLAQNGKRNLKGNNSFSMVISMDYRVHTHFSFQIAAGIASMHWLVVNPT